MVGSAEADAWLARHTVRTDAEGIIVVVLDGAGQPVGYWHEEGRVVDFDDCRKAEYPYVFCSSKDAQYRVSRMARVSGERARIALWQHPDFFGVNGIAYDHTGCRWALPMNVRHEDLMWNPDSQDQDEDDYDCEAA
jgi:hypothetical protein